MINSVGSSAVNQYLFQHVEPAKPQFARAKKEEPHDTVVLSSQAKGGSDPDHDGD